MSDLESLRDKIDQLDGQLLELLNRRAEISLEVGKVKGPGAPIYVPDRETAIIRKLREKSPGPLPPDALEAIYGEILSSSRALQTPLTAAFLGPEGTFSHQAAVLHFGSSTHLVPAPTIPDVFKETEVGRVHLGIVPIENSSEGSEKSSLDSFVDSDLKACAEFRLDVHQTLMSNSELSGITSVLSHPNAIGQCRDWLRVHLPNASIVEVASTAKAAEQASRTPGAAAIAPEVAAKLYGLNVLEPRIEDVAGNVTRFLVIGREMSKRTGRDRMSLLFSIKDRVGVLRDVLAIFVDAGVNVSKIESRPSKRRAWDYLFFADLDTHPEEPSTASALKRLEDLTVYSKVLGAWARSD